MTVAAEIFSDLNQGTLSRIGSLGGLLGGESAEGKQRHSVAESGSGHNRQAVDLKLDRGIERDPESWTGMDNHGRDGAADHPVAADELTALAAEFQAIRPRLFGIAYRMLGSAMEAEDVVQDAWIRWQTTDRSNVRSVAAFLSTMTTRLAMNVATSSRVRRETYIGPWLPEPVLTSTDPALGAENAQALEVGILLMMERLNPMERAVYLLREAFDYSYGEIADVIDTTEVNARQIGRRARLHLQVQTVNQVTTEHKNRLLRTFLAAANAGDLEHLHALLAEDIVVYSDGGGIVTAARRPIEGRERVERFLLGIMEKTGETVEFHVATVNGADAVVLTRAGAPYLVLSISVNQDGINRVFFMMNPEKLGALGATAG